MLLPAGVVDLGFSSLAPSNFCIYICISYLFLRKFLSLSLMASTWILIFSCTFWNTKTLHGVLEKRPILISSSLSYLKKVSEASSFHLMLLCSSWITSSYQYLPI